jgi:hypothetical protein
MPRDDKYQLLNDLRIRKRNRSLGEACRALEAFGFQKRKASKENSIWKKGSVTVTLPLPHGGDPVLLPRYVSMVVREIERALALNATEEGEEEND